MGRYFVDFGTGAGNSYHNTIDEAKQAAEASMAYTGENIAIIDTDTDTLVSIAHWWGVEPDEDAQILCQFGSFGYYEIWEDSE